MLTLSRSGSALLTALTLWLMTSCSLGPDPSRPNTPAHSANSYVESAVPIQEPPFDPTRWWEHFKDPHLNSLVESALEHNPDLQAQAAKVIESEALLKISKSTRFPAANYSLGASRQKSSFVLPGAGRTGIYSTTYSQDLQVQYQLDLFGKLSRARQASLSDFMATREDHETMRHSIISAVVRARVSVGTLSDQFALARKNTESWSTTAELIEHRYSKGLAEPLDLHMARSNLATARDTELKLESSLKTAQTALDILLGAYPGSDSDRAGLPEFPALDPVPPGLPADLLDRRPDIRAAELRLNAATYRVGTAMANLFPGLSLTAGTGIRSDELHKLTSTDGLVYSVIGSLLAPVFQGGQLRADVRAARARMEQQAAVYAGTVLKALKEVEDALSREAITRQRLIHVQNRWDEAVAAEELARDQYMKGIHPFLVLLETERARRLAETETLAVRSDLWNARTDLILALGGDWGVGKEADEPVVPPTEPATLPRDTGQAQTETPRDSEPETIPMTGGNHV